jgi:hypothetical protein
MKASEIILADAQKRGVDGTKALGLISNAVKQKKAVLMQEGNTVLMLTKIANGASEVHLFTQDGVMALATALTAFIKRTADLGVTTVYGKADNQQIIELLKRVGLNVVASDLPQYNWKADL